MSQPPEKFPPHDPQLADLPPVEAPSAGFIVQLFVIPFVIVVVVIAVWLLFGKLAGGERDALTYVQTLKSPGANWRAAFELASLIQNDPKLATDSRLLGELTELLATDLKTDANPKLTEYLTYALGNFQTRDGRTTAGREVDPLTVLAEALDARHPIEVRLGAAVSLAKHAARDEGTLDDPTIIRALTDAAHDPAQPELRKVAIWAIGFCQFDAVAPLLRTSLSDEYRDARYQAAIALVRQGDPAAVAVLREMLSSPDLNRVLEASSPAEKGNQIERVELEALAALQTAVGHGRLDLAGSLRPEIAKLGNSGLVAVRNSAMALLKALPESR